MAPPDQHHAEDDSEPEMLAAEDALEEVDGMGEDGDDGEDVAMDSGDDDDDDEPEELLLTNDSIAYFDGHKDSVFAIAQHPRFPSLVATGGGEGDADDAPGKGYVLDTSAAAPRPLLPASYSSDPEAAAAADAAHKSTGLQPLFAIDGHTDSINALVFTQPDGDFLVSGGLDGRLRVYSVKVQGGGDVTIQFVTETQEVPEVNWLAACPAADHPNTVALGASDGSVWVYALDAAAAAAAGSSGGQAEIVQSYFLHTASCTAGAWSPDGQLLATVSEDSSLHVWDVWGTAAARGISGSGGSSGGQTVVSLTAADQRFEVEGGLYSVAVSPGGGVVAVGGAGGIIKIVGLPRLTETAAGAGKQRGGSRGARGASAPQAGTILASLQVQSDGVETLSFAPPPLTLLAAGSVDGSVAVYDASRSFAVRRHIAGAHDEFSVVQVEWVRSPPVASAAVAAAGGPAQWLLTSCGMDGVVRRWDLRGTAAAHGAAAAQRSASSAGSGNDGPPVPAGLVKEWRGHRGEGEGGGVLGFVQGQTGERIVTAGDDGIVLVFEA